MGSQTDDSKPFILYADLPSTGHVEPGIQIASHMVNAGYDVTMMSTPRYRAQVEAAGLRYHQMQGLISQIATPEFQPTLAKVGGTAQLDLRDPRVIGDPDTSDVIYESVWTFCMPSMYACLFEALSAVKIRAGPHREVLLVSNTWFSGVVPLRLGAPLPDGFSSPPKSMGINVMPSVFCSVDLPPYGTWMTPDPAPTEASRERNRKLAAMRAMARHPVSGRTYRDRAQQALFMCGVMRPLQEIFDAYGGPDITQQPVWAASQLAHDVTLQMCIPPLEYPASDRPAHLRFGGTLPRKPLPRGIVYPPWWGEVLANSRKNEGKKGFEKRKKIVMVAQGTIEKDHETLVVPTIRGLASRAEDVLVVAVLCIRGATLDHVFTPYPAGTTVHTGANGVHNGTDNSKLRHHRHNLEKQPLEPLPSNVRVIDYFPYDAVLEHADVFATNSGYGGFQHAVCNAVPVVQTGLRIDKPEIGRRVVYAGLGVQITSVTVTPEEIAAAVGKVLGDPRYAVRAEELRKEAEEFDALGTVLRELEALWKGK